MIYLKLRQAGEIVNHKRVDRLYAEVGLQVKKRRRKKIPLSDRQPLESPTGANQVWSMDFVFDRTAEGRSGSAKLNRSDKCIIGVFILGKGAGAGYLYEQIIWAANPPRV
jgi:transposase InsO family protein